MQATPGCACQPVSQGLHVTWMRRARTGDGLHAVQEGVVLGHALVAEAPEEALHHAVHGAQQDAALAVDVAAVLTLQRGACARPQAQGAEP